MLSVLDSRPTEDRAAGSFPWWGPYPISSYQSPEWALVAEEQILAIAAASACIELLADQMSVAPMYVEHPDGSTSPVPAILRQPDPEMTCCDVISQVVVSLLTTGNAFAVITSRERDGMPRSIKVLSPWQVSVSRWEDSRRLRYMVDGAYVPRQDIVHVRGLTIAGCDVGIGPITYGYRTFKMAQRESIYATDRFDGSGNSAAIPDYFIESDQSITVEQAQEVQAQLQRRHGGLQRGPTVLTNGLRAKTIQYSARELELIVSRKFTATEICSIFRVPAHLVGVQVENSMTYSNVRDDMVGLATLRLEPFGMRMGAGLSHRLLPPGDLLRFDFDKLKQDLGIPDRVPKSGAPQQPPKAPDSDPMRSDDAQPSPWAGDINLSVPISVDLRNSANAETDKPLPDDDDGKAQPVPGAE